MTINIDRVPHCDRKTGFSFSSAPSSYGGLTPSQFELLATLHHIGDEELFRLSGIPMRTVNSLVSRGLATIKDRDYDEGFSSRYAVIVEAGRGALAKAWKAYDRYEAQQTREREAYQRKEDRRREIYEASRWFLYSECVGDYNRQHTYKRNSYVWRFIRIDGEQVPHLARDQAEYAADWPKKEEGDSAWWSWNLKGIVASHDSEAVKLAQRVLGDRFCGKVKHD